MQGALLLMLLTMCRLHSAPGDEHWDARFGFPGAFRPYALAIAESNLFGAVFYTATNFTGVSRLVGWDGTGWQ